MAARVVKFLYVNNKSLGVLPIPVSGIYMSAVVKVKWGARIRLNYNVSGREANFRVCNLAQNYIASPPH